MGNEDGGEMVTIGNEDGGEMVTEMIGLDDAIYLLLGKVNPTDPFDSRLMQIFHVARESIDDDDLGFRSAVAALFITCSDEGEKSSIKCELMLLRHYSNLTLGPPPGTPEIPDYLRPPPTPDLPRPGIDFRPVNLLMRWESIKNQGGTG